MSGTHLLKRDTYQKSRYEPRMRDALRMARRHKWHPRRSLSLLQQQLVIPSASLTNHTATNFSRHDPWSARSVKRQVFVSVRHPSLTITFHRNYQSLLHQILSRLVLLQSRKVRVKLERISFCLARG